MEPDPEVHSSKRTASVRARAHDSAHAAGSGDDASDRSSAGTHVRDAMGETAGPGTAANRAGLKAVMGRFATGVSVVTCTRDPGRPIGSTVSALSSVSLDPPLVLVCLREESETLAALVERGAFAINMLAADQQPLAELFAKRSQRDGWRGIRYRRGMGGMPLLEGTVAALECSLHDVSDGGDHKIVVGRVLHVRHAHGDVRPLLHFRGEYAMLQPRAAPVPVSAPTTGGLPGVFMPTPAGEMTLIPVEDGHSRATSLVALVGQPRGSSGTLVYLHRGCLLGDALGHLACARRRALDQALALIRAAGSGVLVYHRDDDSPFAGCCVPALDTGAASRSEQEAYVSALRATLTTLDLRRVRLLRSEQLQEQLPHALLGLDVATTEHLEIPDQTLA